MRGTGLGRHLAILMTKVTCYSVAISFLVWYVWIEVWTWYSGVEVNETIDGMTLQDWLLFAVSTVLSLLVAFMTAARFARRLLLPLDSLAKSARKIAEGELSARAVAGDRRLSETTALVDDFNIMAEKLEVASSEIKLWNAAIAHELRTPVTILRGRLQGLADGIFPPDKTLFLNLVRQTEGLARLIEDLRTVSLAENGHLRLHREKVGLSREIVEVAELLKPTFSASGLSLVLNLDDVTAECDTTRIRQALLALLENTRRYAAPGVVMITCRQQQDWVTIGVDDEGPGIPPEIAQTLFDPFIRGDDSRSRASGGTGLGLTVVQAIISAHGGQASCSPGELGGTAFRLRFPVEVRTAEKL